MIRIAPLMFLASVALSSPVFAAGTPGASPAPQDSASVTHAAEKICSDALDHDRFNYDSMESCVSDTSAKLAASRPKEAR